MRQIVVNNTPRKPHNPFFPEGAPAPYTHIEHFLEAVVVDVITNDTHPEYSDDGYNVGMAKVRLLKTNFYRDDAALNWAFPSDTNIVDYPLVGEIVLVTSMLNRLYYIKRVNITNRSTAHAFRTLNNEYQPIAQGKVRVRDLETTVAGNPVKETGEQTPLGQYFQDLKQIYRLKSFEGDIIYEGRSGQSIRFGSAFTDAQEFRSSEVDQSPTILMRVGQAETVTPTTDTEYGLVLENINDDASSLWMVADQIISLKTATQDDREIHRKSIVEYPSVFDGAQIVLNSDRLLLNAKRGEFILHTSRGIHHNTLKDFTVDAGQDYFSYIRRDTKIQVNRDYLQNIDRNWQFWVGKDTTLDIGSSYILRAGQNITISAGQDVLIRSGGTITVGGTSGAQAMVLGDDLKDFLTQFLNAFLEGPFGINGAGPVKAFPSFAARLASLRSAYLTNRRILSDKNRVTKTNSAETVQTKQTLHG